MKSSSVADNEESQLMIKELSYMCKERDKYKLMEILKSSYQSESELQSFISVFQLVLFRVEYKRNVWNE